MLILAALLFTVIRSELIHLGLKNYSMSKKEYSPLLIYYHGSDRNSKKFLPEYELIA